MKKSHVAYLRRLIGKAISTHDRDEVTDEILRIKAPATEMHQMIRDIVCDVRFYSVLDSDAFWKGYGAFSIAGFIDSIPQDQWREEESRTLLKE